MTPLWMVAVGGGWQEHRTGFKQGVCYPEGSLSSLEHPPFARPHKKRAAIARRSPEYFLFVAGPV